MRFDTGPAGNAAARTLSKPLPDTHRGGKDETPVSAARTRYPRINQRRRQPRLLPLPGRPRRYDRIHRRGGPVGCRCRGWNGTAPHHPSRAGDPC